MITLTNNTPAQQLIKRSRANLAARSHDADLYLYWAGLLASQPSADARLEARTLLLHALNMNLATTDAWLLLARLLNHDGCSSAACTAYQAFLTHHPQHASAHIELAHRLLDAQLPTDAIQHYHTALNLISPLGESMKFASAHQGLSAAYDQLNESKQADYHRQIGFSVQAILPLGSTNPVAKPVLILMSAWNGNLPWRRLIDTLHFNATVVCIEYLPESTVLPTNTLIFNAIGDADLCLFGLQRAHTLLDQAGMSAINHPREVLLTGRQHNAERLARIANVRCAAIHLLRRDQLHTGALPMDLRENAWLLRALGFHSGEHFIRIDAIERIPQALAMLPGEEWLCMPFIDTCDTQGRYRKYRVMCIGDRLYPLHMAASHHWKVHYFSADANDDPDMQAAEVQFLTQFEQALLPKSIHALQEIQHMMGLDYCGIDFTIDRDGSLVIFEANATMTINPPDQQSGQEARWQATQTALHAMDDLLKTTSAHISTLRHLS